MLADLMITTIALLVLLGGWVAVQAAGRQQTRRHPEIGSYHEAGCGGHCGGCGESCETADPSPSEGRAHVLDAQELR